MIKSKIATCKIIIIVIILWLTPQFTLAQNNSDSLSITDCSEYTTPKPLRFIKNVPDDVVKMFESPFHKKNLKGLLIVGGVTCLLIPFDVQISEGVKHFSQQIHINAKEDYDSPVRFKDARIIKIPQNINSAFYQLGEGGTTMIVAGGLFLYGKIKNKPKPLNVASDIVESTITVGLCSQIIKRFTGRETPSRVTDEDGDSEWWQFPGFKEFQKNTPKYDSYPSGHLATMASTVATLMLNYPEKKWIKILGGSLIGLTGLSMINNDVHWLSDYPLALALGYVSAKITFDRNHRQHVKKIIL